MAQTDRTAFIDTLVQEYAQLLEERVPPGPLTLEQIETLVEELGRHQNSHLEEALIRSQVPPPDNQVACPRCQSPARFKLLVPLDVLTIHGSRRLTRRYHRCAACGHGFAPLDLGLALEGRNATRLVRAWQAKYGSQGVFADVPELLLELRGLVISESTIERTTIEVGTALAQAEAQEVALAASSAGSGAGTRRRGPGVARLYVEMDGCFCPLRDPWCKDGSLGKLHCRFGECKLGVVFQTGHKDGLDEGVLWRAYTATLEKIEGFTPRMVSLARRHGCERAQELVALGDGADWIWKLCDKHFPRALQIVDYWHMTQHLYAVANGRFGKGTEAAKKWVTDCQWYLDRDLTETVLANIQEWKPENKEDLKLRDTEFGYFANNRERMRYGTFLKRGYHIGSGVVEASCKQLVGKRLDQTGMHWRQASAEAVLAIRAKLKSTAPTDLRDYC